MTTRYAERIIKYRWWVIFLCVAGMVAIASGARFLKFSSDYRVFFSEDNPQLQAFEQLQNTYTKNDNVLLVLEPKDGGNVFSQKFLSVVEDVTREAWQTPYSIRVDSVTNFQHTWARGDDLVVEDLVKNAESLSPAQLQRAKEIALNEPLLLHRLINPEADITAVNVTVQLPGKHLGETGEVVAFSRKLAEDIRSRHPEVNVYLTGIVFMNNAFNEAGEGDMKTLVPIMYLVALLIMAFALRSVWGTLATILVIAFSIVSGMGLAGWSGVQLTPISANAPTIILTLAVADSIHILVTLFHQIRAGRSREKAIVESLRINMQPVFITSITTAIGFMSLNLSDSPPFRDLGNIVAVGVIAAWVYSVTLLPALMAVLPLRTRASAQVQDESVFDRLGGFVIAHRGRLFWVLLAFTLLSVSQVTRIEINEKFNEYFDERYAFRTDNDYVVDRLTGFETIEYSLSAGEPGGIANPEYLQKLEEFAEWYRKQPGVLYVGVLTDVMKRLNKNMHGDDESYYTIPENRQLSAQYLLLYELSLPFGLDLNNQISVDKGATRFTAVFDNVSTRLTLETEERAQSWLREHGLKSMVTPGASPLIMFSHIAMRNIESMAGGLVFALILISAILIVALRSFRLGFISLIPNLVPIFVTFGIWGIFFREVGLAASVVAPVALGIIVDDTVHFLSKYQRARHEQGKNPEEAVRYAFHTVGSALWITSLILVAGFLVLNFSGFRMNSEMGSLTTLAIVVALIADFFFLPPLLMKLDSVGEGQNVGEESPRALVP